jgi:thiol-disulfide isomerase/thioredoxin
MKKRISLVLLVIGVTLTIVVGFTSSSFNPNIDKSQQNYKLILGEFSLRELKSSINKKWFEAQYDIYDPKPSTTSEIASVFKNKDLSITVYMGTWCEDSQREFPAFIKVLDKTGFNKDKLKIVGVDENKKVPNISEEERKALNIINVPTIIVYNSNGNEMNRFVEFPQQTLEEDLLKIVSGKDYKHVYEF